MSEPLTKWRWITETWKESKQLRNPHKYKAKKIEVKNTITGELSFFNSIRGAMTKCGSNYHQGFQNCLDNGGRVKEIFIVRLVE